MKNTINKVNRRQNRIIAMSKTDKKFISRLYKTTTTKEKQAKAVDNLTRRRKYKGYQAYGELLKLITNQIYAS